MSCLHHEIMESADTGEAAKELEATRTRLMLLILMAMDQFFAADEQASRLLPGEAATSRALALLVLVRNLHSAVEQAYRESYSLGRGLWGRAAAAGELSDSAQAVLDKEKRFAFRFAVDLARRTPKKGASRVMPEGPRASMYGDAIEGAYHRGAVDAAPDGTLIWWRLGDARHCSDCPNLAANSPYTRETLPTTPRSGGTKCWSKCRCRLEFTDASGNAARPLPGIPSGPPPPRPPQRPRSAPTRPALPPPPPPPETGRPGAPRPPQPPRVPRAPAPLPVPPAGKRLPTAEEQAVIRDLRQRAAFANRRAVRAGDEGDRAEMDRWLRVRSEINGALIDFTKTRGIFSPPSFTDKEVLSSLDVTLADIDMLTHLRGIDGFTVSRAQAQAIEAASLAAQKRMMEQIARIPPDFPAVPDFEKLLRAAGAPEYTLGDAVVAPVDPRAITEASQIADPAEVQVYSAIGMGTAATLRAAAAVFLVLSKSAYDVVVGPLDEDFVDMVSDSGLWIKGPDAAKFIAALSAHIGGRGLEVATWQP